MKLGREQTGRKQPLQQDRLQTRNVFSYHANRQAERPAKSPRIMVPKVGFSQALHRLPAALLVLALLLFLGYGTSLTTNPKVSVIGPQNKLMRPVKEYQQAAEKQLNGSIMNRTKITIDASQLSQNLRTQFPELKDVAVTLPLMGRRPLVELVISQPALILTSRKDSYVLDENGRALLQTSNLSEIADLNVPTVVDQSNLAIKAGEGALTKQEVAFITTLLSQLQTQNIAITKLELPPAAHELRVQVKDASYYIKFNFDTDPRLSAGMLVALRGKFAAEHITPSEYVDLRIEERAYYK